MPEMVLQQTGVQEWRDSSGAVLLAATEWLPMYSEIVSGVPGGPFHHAWPADKRLADQMGLGPCR